MHLSTTPTAVAERHVGRWLDDRLHDAASWLPPENLYCPSLTHEEGALYARSGYANLARLEMGMDPQEVSNLRRQAETIYQQCCH